MKQETLWMDTVSPGAAPRVP